MRQRSLTISELTESNVRRFDAALTSLNTMGNASPNGAPDAAWFWNNPGTAGQSLKAFQTDFVWAIPLLAIPQ
jgi:hypothetical protein